MASAGWPYAPASSETWISFLTIPQNAIPQEMLEIFLSPALCHILAPHKSTHIWPWCCRHSSMCLKTFSKPVELVMQSAPLSKGYLFKWAQQQGPCNSSSYVDLLLDLSLLSGPPWMCASSLCPVLGLESLEFFCLSYHFYGLCCSGTNSSVNVTLQRGCSTL